MQFRIRKLDKRSGAINHFMKYEVRFFSYEDFWSVVHYCNQSFGTTCSKPTWLTFAHVKKHQRPVPDYFNDSWLFSLNDIGGVGSYPPRVYLRDEAQASQILLKFK